MFLVRMPSLAENVAEATLAAWLVKEGDKVRPGDGIAEIVTEKAAFTLEADAGGKVTALLAAEKSVLPVGAILCALDANAEDLAAARAENERLFAQHAASLVAGHAEPKSETVARVLPAGAVRATPAARRLAKEHNLSLVDVATWLANDRPVREEDVRAYLNHGAAKEEKPQP